MVGDDVFDRLSSVAWKVADTIESLKSAQTNQQKALKRLLIIPLWTFLQSGAPSLIRENQELKSYLQDVACSLDQLFDIGSDDLQTLARWCDDPASIDSNVRPRLSIAELGPCIELLERWNHRWNSPRGKANKAADSPAAGIPNPRTIQHPAPRIDHSVFEGNGSTHYRTELLHETLRRNWPCRDARHNHGYDSKHPAMAKLCLGPSWNFQQPTKTFLVVLSGHGISQEYKFLVSDTSRDGQGASFCLVAHDKFRAYCLHIMIYNTQQLKIRQKEHNSILTPSFHEISMRQLMSKITLTICARRVIGLVVARALLHLLGGKWVYGPVSIDNVLFYYTVVDGKPFFHFDKVFLSIDFPEERPGTPESFGEIPVSPLQCIWELAATLAKLELGEHFSRVDRQVGLSRLEANPTALGQVLIQQCGYYSNPPSTVKLCINRSPFEEFEDLDAEELRLNRDFIDTYYREVIRPLEAWLINAGGWTSKQVDDLDPCVIDSQGICWLDDRAGPEIHSPRMAGLNAPKPRFVLGPQQDLEEDVRIEWSGQPPPGCVMDYTSADPKVSAELAESWLSNLKVMHDSLYRMPSWPLQDEKLLPKVAIIDTGCQLEHPEIKPYITAKKIAKWRDFVLKNDDIVDLEGHGTHVTHLLLKAAPHVRVYLARAFESSDANHETASLVAQAIRYAADDWGVDIISMSFAFDQWDPDISSAINHAVGRGVLLFAAASNNWANRLNPIGYPARETNVICVNSTDHQGNKSAFSPEGIERDYNFAILGESLTAAWPPLLNKDAPGQPLRSVSGTSQATPLVAGIAATVLHVTRMRQFGPFKSGDLLRQTRGMSRVLYECMTKKQRAPAYNFVTPGDLLGQQELKDILPNIRNALRGI